MRDFPIVVLIALLIVQLLYVGLSDSPVEVLDHLIVQFLHARLSDMPLNVL